MNFNQRNLYVLLDGPMGECYLFFLHIMNGSQCIWVLQNLNVKARVTIMNL